MPMMISGKNMEKYKLKTGPGLRDVVPFQEFDKEWVQAEIQEIGFYSDFFNFREHINMFPEEKLLIIADPDEKYGENWLICLTGQAKKKCLSAAQAKKDEADAAAKAIQDEIDRKKAEELAALNAVYEDKPIIPNEWVTDHQDQTDQQVRQLTVKSSREPLALCMTRKRREFGDSVKFSDRADSGLAECRQHKDPNYELKKMELDVALQSVPETIEAASQTTWFRSVNKTLQYDAIEMEADKAKEQLEDPKLLAFLRGVQVEIEEALQQNETVDLFGDEFGGMGEDDVALNNNSGNNIKELRTFADLKYSKNKALPAIDWHPKKKGIVAVAAVGNFSFDQRVQKSGKVSTSYLLIWDFTDLIHPQLMLQSPHDTYCFRYNPTQPHIIAAGCISGQVVLWDTTEASKMLQRKRGKNASDDPECDDNGDSSDKDKTVPPVKHASISHIDTSHRRPVADLTWLPPGMEVDHRGKIEQTDETVSYQFLTVAGDGQVCIWDTRYKEIAKANPRLHKELKPNKDGSMPEVMWQPQYKLTLTKLEGVGELGLARSKLNCNFNGRKSRITDFASQFFCGTEEGEMVFADWKPKPKGDDGGGGDDDDGGGDAPEYVQWMSQDHFRPCVSLEQSPFFPDILLSVSDWSFNLWQKGLKKPLFSSPLSSAYLTSGRWSPTRPGVLMVAKADGSIDVWDFTDRSHMYSTSVNATAFPINSMEFWNTSNLHAKQQLLAVSESSGTLHILDIPRNLWRPLSNEMEMMEAFFTRERQHVDYVSKRTVVRDGEKAVLDAEGEKEEEEEEEKQVDTDALKAEEEKAEEEYKQMECKFRSELGLASGQKNGSDDDDEDGEEDGFG